MSEHDPPDFPAPTATGSVRGALGEPRALGAARAELDAEFSSFYRATIRPLVGFLLNHGATLPLAADIAQEVMS
ncbi:hypothetical protein J5X84_42880 [Streptosporangiaceae bacterium NEAU-GS5]|nr:hypothetical protein [Streptosporangiaceae bacterium NEAU-GS5]